MKQLFVLVCLTVVGMAARAQYSRYIIRFTDKKGTAYTLANPSAYLSAKAIERRTKQHITIDSTDLPVSAAYLDSILKVPNVTVLNVSKWQNQVLIRTTDVNALNKIRSFPFVKNTDSLAVRIQQGDHIIAGNKFTETVLPLQSSINKVNAATVLNYGNNFNQVHIHRGEFLHNHGLTGKGITMAVLDAGFFGYTTNAALDSVRLQNRILGTWDYVKNEASVTEDDTHGLYCFSIIAANKPGQIVGTAPKASFWLLRTEDAGSEYPVEEQNWAAAAEFADSAGVDMISSSLGYSLFDNPVFNHTYAQRDGNTSIVTRAADYAARKGMIVMNSAGNDGARADDYKYAACPADGDSVVAVGATTTAGVIASFSSWGPNGAGKVKPNIVSVGQGTVFANTAGNPASGSGTSFSNPNIAGLIACLWQAFPERSNMELIDAVQKSAHKYNNPDERFGYGLPDFKKAMVSLTQQQATAASSFSNCMVDLQWSSKDDSSVTYTIARKLPGEPVYTIIKQVRAANAAFKLSSYAWQDTLTGSGNGTAEYTIVQSFGTDTTFEIATVQQAINTVCFPPNTVRLLPNPFRQQFNVVINTPEAITNMSIQVSDQLGRIVYKRTVNKPAGYFNLPIYTADWQDGVYNLKLLNGNKKIEDRKLLKLPQ
jgi:serine protease AprX